MATVPSTPQILNLAELAALRTRVAELEALNEALAAQLAARDAQLEAAQARLAVLAEQIEELRRRLGRDSSTSSKPPSSDSPPVLAAHIAELDEAKQDGDGDLWDDVSSEGLEVELGLATWEVWLGDDGWTASRPTSGSEIPGGSTAFGEGDLIETVGPATPRLSWQLFQVLV